METLERYVEEGLTTAEIARKLGVTWAAAYRRLQNEGLAVKEKDRRELLLTRDEMKQAIETYGSITNMYHQIALKRGWDWAHIHSLYRLVRVYGLKAPRHNRKKVAGDGTWIW